LKKNLPFLSVSCENRKAGSTRKKTNSCFGIKCYGLKIRGEVNITGDIDFSISKSFENRMYWFRGSVTFFIYLVCNIAILVGLAGKIAADKPSKKTRILAIFSTVHSSPNTVPKSIKSTITTKVFFCCFYQKNLPYSNAMKSRYT